MYVLPCNSRAAWEFSENARSHCCDRRCLRRRGKLCVEIGSDFLNCVIASDPHGVNHFLCIETCLTHGLAAHDWLGTIAILVIHKRGVAKLRQSGDLPGARLPLVTLRPGWRVVTRRQSPQRWAASLPLPSSNRLHVGASSNRVFLSRKTRCLARKRLVSRLSNSRWWGVQL